MENVEQNKFFKYAKKRAAAILKNKGRLGNLLYVAADKFKHANVKNIKTSSLVARLGVITRMIKAYSTGTYKNIKLTNLLLLVAAVVYFVTPIDLVPDFIPITGFLDDFTVVVWVYSKLQEEIDLFIDWENEQFQEIEEL